VKRLYGVLMHQLGRRAGLNVFRVLSQALASSPQREPAGMEVRTLDASELLPHCSLELDLTPTMVREAARRGDVCVGALSSGQLAGYVWFARQEAPHVRGVWVRVPEQAIYRYKAFVRPEWRGRRIAPALDAFAARLFRSSGRDCFVTCIATHNFSALRASKVSGARELGTLGYWQAGSRFVAFHSAAVRRLGLRFYFRGDGNA
jgi:GNAT superfamily N-acetyltransferase